MCCRPAWMWCSCTALGLTDVCRKAVRSFGCPQQPCPAPQPVGCVPSVWELPQPGQPEQCWPEEQLGTGQLWGTWQLNISTAQASFIKGLRLNPFRHSAKGTSLIACSHSSPCPREQGSQRARSCVNRPFQECQTIPFSLPFNSCVLTAVTKIKQNKIHQPVWFQSAQFDHQEGSTWQEETEHHRMGYIQTRICDSFHSYLVHISVYRYCNFLCFFFIELLARLTDNTGFCSLL